MSRKKQSALILFGVVLGCSAYVLISSMMLGFQVQIVEQLVNNDSHVRVSSRQDFVSESTLNRVMYQESLHVFWKVPPSGVTDYNRIENPVGWFTRLEKDSGVLAYSPQIISQVIVSRGLVSKATRMIGVNPGKQEQVTNISDYMVEGKFRDIGSSGNRLIVGDSLLIALGARVSESVLVSSGVEKPVPFKIIGKFHTGIKAIDEGTAFGALADIQKVNHTPSNVTDIAIKLVDVENADKYSQKWKQASKETVQSWSEANEGIMSVFKIQDFTRNFMTISILMVAGFGIYNILGMMVAQKRREIAILRSMGYERVDIVQLFVIRGVLFGVLGGMLGVLLGFLASKYLATIPFAKDGMISGPGQTLPFSFDTLIYVKGFVLAFISCLFASYLPARAAGSLTPIEIIRSKS